MRQIIQRQGTNITLRQMRLEIEQLFGRPTDELNTKEWKVMIKEVAAKLANE